MADVVQQRRHDQRVRLDVTDRDAYAAAADEVQRVFVPREAYRELQVGESIGRVLVEQQAVTQEQVERAAQAATKKPRGRKPKEAAI